MGNPWSGVILSGFGAVLTFGHNAPRIWRNTCFEAMLTGTGRIPEFGAMLTRSGGSFGFGTIVTNPKNWSFIPALGVMNLGLEQLKI